MSYKLIGIVTGIALILGGAIALLRWVGNALWREGTETLRQQLTGVQQPIHPTLYDPRELESLPFPVQRYLQIVLKPGQPMIARAHLQSGGQFSLAEAAPPHWVPFTADQQVVLNTIGFDWDGRVLAAPGLMCFVHDAYVAGEGRLQATVWGLIPLAHQQGTREIARGELMRFLAESPWYPTALLPSQGVQWEEIDPHRAQATLTDGAIQVTLEFRFGADSLIEQVSATARDRTVKNQLVPTPWQGRFWNYQKYNDLIIPTEGEVAWQLPSGLLPYWRGHLKRIQYEFAQ